VALNHNKRSPPGSQPDGQWIVPPAPDPSTLPRRRQAVCADVAYRCRRAAGGAIDRDRRRLSEFLFSRCKRGRWFAGKPSKVKGSPYSISERRVPKLIPVLGSQSQMT